MAEADRKPNPVSGTGYPIPADDHSSVGACYQTPPATYPGAQAGSLQSLLYLVLHRVGFTKLLQSPGELVRSYRTISPLPGCFHFARYSRKAKEPGGIFSVALSFALPRLHVMEHPALWCSDFPPDPDESGDRLFYFGQVFLLNLLPVNDPLTVRTHS